MFNILLTKNYLFYSSKKFIKKTTLKKRLQNYSVQSLIIMFYNMLNILLHVVK